MHRPHDQESGLLPVREKVAWGMGAFGETLAAGGLNVLFTPIYNIGFGMSSVLVGWAIAIPRFVDMITDPLMGDISDRHRSRYGRRRPFIFAGTFLMAFSAALCYLASPYWSEGKLFAYTLATCTFFYLMYTIFAVPYSALGLELTDDYDERTDVQKYRMAFASLAIFATPWFYKACLTAGEYIRAHVESGLSTWYGFLLQPIAQMAADPGVKVEVLGVRYMAWALAIGIIVTALPAALFTREKVHHDIPHQHHFLRSGWHALQNHSFRTVCLMIFFVICGMFYMGVFATYANIFYVCGGDKSSGATWNGFYGTVSGVASLLAALAMPALTRWLDKKKVLMIGLGVSAAAIGASWFLLNPAYPALQLVIAFVVGGGTGACWMLCGALIADICDEDELLHGHRREGIFSAFYGFAVKLAFSGIALTVGYALVFVGYDAGNEKMSPEALTRLRLFIALVPSVCLLAAMAVFVPYSLSRDRLRDIQEALRLRRASRCGGSGQ